MQIKKEPIIKDPKIKIFLLIIVVLFLVLLNVILSIVLKVKENNQNVGLSYDTLSTVKDVVEYYKSRYISEDESEDTSFYTDVYLEFRYKPYNEDDTSNEKYYNDLIKDCARVLDYKSFRMLDKKNELKIEVRCIDGVLVDIFINGRNDYFIYMDSMASVKKYKEIPYSELEVTSDVLNQVIDINWDSASFGDKDSIFDYYYIYNQAGLKVRTINNKIYNMIFTKNYQGNVIANLFPGVDLKSVETSLGKATFKDKELGVYGYKTKKFYVFFTKDEISVYRNSDMEADEFFTLVEKYSGDSFDILEFMNQLTYMWPDYSKYTYSSSYVYICYPIKGIEISINNNDISGFLLYNNIKSKISKVTRILENTDYIGRLQTDLVYKVEKERIEEKNAYATAYDEYIESLDKDSKELIGESLYYKEVPKMERNKSIYSIKFISQSDRYVDRELNDGVDQYFWVTNTQVIYSKMGKGLFLYDLENGSINRFISGSDKYEIKKYEDGVLYYDDTSIQIQ